MSLLPDAAGATQPFRAWAIVERLTGQGPEAAVVRLGFLAFLVRVCGAASTFGVQILLARLLVPSVFGAYVYALAWVNFLVMLGVLGLDTASLRFVASYQGLGEWGKLRGFLVYCLRLNLRTGVLIGACLALGGSLLGLRDRSDVPTTLMVAGVLLPVLASLQVISAWIQAFKRAVISQLIQGVVRPMLLAALLLVTVRGLGWTPTAPGTMGLHLLAAAISLTAAWGMVRRSMPTQVQGVHPVTESALWVRTALPLLLITGGQLLLGQADVLMLGAMVGTTQAGTYAVASQLADLIIFGINAANIVVAPAIADLHIRGQRDELQRLLTRVSRIVMLFAVPVALVLVFGGTWLLGIYGPTFRAGALPMAILAIGELTISLAGSVGFLLTMTGHERVAGRIVVGSAILNIVLNTVLIPAYGLTGAAIATVIATVVRTLLLSLVVHRNLGLNPTAF